MTTPAQPSEAARRNLPSWLVPILLGVFCFLVYNANFRLIGAGDTLPARYLPLILWHKGTLNLHSDVRLVAHGHSMIPNGNRPAQVEGRVAYFEPWAYWMIRTRQHQLASLYPVVTPLLVAPLYLPAVLWLNKEGWSQPRIDRAAELMEKLSASIMAAIASVLMYLVLRRDCGRWSLPLALIFALGTNTWMISSQALWQHGTGELLIALALLLSLARATTLRTALLGAVCVLIAANRPPDGLIACAFVLFAFWRRRSGALWLFAGAAIPLAALLYYNLHFIGHLAGGYAIGKSTHHAFMKLNWLGLPGLLVSPARGLLVFAPFFLFLPVGFMRRFREPGTKGLAVALCCAATAQVLLYSQADWRAGECWGPRWLTDLLPIFMWMLAPAALALRPFARGIFILAAAASVAVQTIGAFWYTKTSDDLIFAGEPASMRGAWDLRNIPFLVELRHPAASAELLCDTRGFVDRIGETLINDGVQTPLLEPGAVMEGWALCGGKTPAQVLALIDGVIVGSANEFQPRADIDAAMQTKSPSAWRVTADTKGVPSGKRTLQIAVRIDLRSPIRIVDEQRVTVVAPTAGRQIGAAPQTANSSADLAVMAERAATQLREHKSKDGYWLTSFTNGRVFENPQVEMNTYLTSLLVDMLAPVAGRWGLDQAMDGARRHLAAQIEGNGLVRYHGLPDAPTIGKLGCAITPDADDTALVWRIARAGVTDSRLKPMLKELARYRDVRGLYRTWLAPRNEYQNLDPGRDPNPTDFCIQIHVYLMLREFDPPAAQRLLKALERSSGDVDVWVYYSKAPLIPYLRIAELQKLGCAIPLPGDRLALVAEEQMIWSEAARLLVAISASPHDAKLRESARQLLESIASDGFGPVRRSPPLIYHNDLTATVKRFYWSEDFGYALWLRLYDVTREINDERPQRSP